MRKVKVVDVRETIKGLVHLGILMEGETFSYDDDADNTNIYMKILQRDSYVDISYVHLNTGKVYTSKAETKVRRSQGTLTIENVEVKF